MSIWSFFFFFFLFISFFLSENVLLSIFAAIPMRSTPTPPRPNQTHCTACDLPHFS
ncbi:hypothetical protein RchiOBHm_Chr2g0119891 [Rosa chinensis]|uniref:Uncharacterized protein n=1 Tax=Rosa chinensis TaxID=74649 RepID=A0A2P6RS43_ROSCH|nr:hypothetical protein RchiOBHm_Chr2g0119891 [Rosa chinensis]